MYKVDGWNNFCRVFEIPEEYPKGFCFDGGKLTEFYMVDWFNPIASVPQSGVTKEVWREKVGEIEVTEISHEELCDTLIPWLIRKTYIKPDKKYLVICDFDATFIFNS